ncbi:MAG: TetR/AcrR family transcriptional regulator [Clostridia bacterium]|nr:TetR/AcrR family transcriptional regulator [Clostridia bacterium]
MSFQRARTAAQIDERQQEIVNACRDLFDEGGYDAVSFRTIGEKTSFSRPSIYNYYTTKEEVFLDLIRQEYEGWREAVEAIRAAGIPQSPEAYSQAITKSLRGRDRLTHLMAIHYTAISQHCSQERLTSFQKSIQSFFDDFAALLHDSFPNASTEKQGQFRVLFFSLVSGLYPLTHLTPEQTTALKASSPEYDAPDFYDMLYLGLIQLLKMLYC